MAFDLASVLKNDVSNLDTGLEQIEYIPIDKIDPDPNNFYALEGLEDLAASIETVGLQQPLRVRTGENGHVIVVSGHRRRAAVMLIIDGGSDQFKNGVPCIREGEAGSAALQELRLIYANSGTRVLSSAEISKQAERVEALLYQLQEEGYEFPGRMRDHVAQACNVSKTKLARLKVIRDNLDHQFKTQYEEGKLSEHAAYAIARLPQDVRDTLALAVPKRIIDGYAAERVLAQYKDGIGTMPECQKGGKCSNCAGHLRRVATSNGWEHQCVMSECCIKCSHRSSCSGACFYAQQINEKEKAKQATEREKQALKDEERRSGYRQQTIDNAKRLLKAIEAAGLKDDVHLDWGTFASNICATVHNVKDTAAGRIKKDAYFYRAECSAEYGSSAVRLAKQLGCSADYLLGLTDDLNPVSNLDTKPEWKTGIPTAPGSYFVKAEFEDDFEVIKIQAQWDGENWTFRDGSHAYLSDLDANVIGWWPLPDD